MNLSLASSFPIDFKIFPICRNKAVKQINDFPCFPAQTLLLTSWRDLLVRQADVSFAVVQFKVNILHGPSHAANVSVCLPYLFDLTLNHQAVQVIVINLWGKWIQNEQFQSDQTHELISWWIQCFPERYSNSHLFGFRSSLSACVAHVYKFSLFVSSDS